MKKRIIIAFIIFLFAVIIVSLSGCGSTKPCPAYPDHVQNRR